METPVKFHVKGYSRDEGPFLAPFDHFLLKRNAVMSVAENSISVTLS